MQLEFSRAGEDGGASTALIRRTTTAGAAAIVVGAKRIRSLGERTRDNKAVGWRRLERRDAKKKIQFAATRPRVTLTHALSHSLSHLPCHTRPDRGTSSPPPPATPAIWLRRLLPRFTLVRTDPADLTHRLKHSLLLLVATSSAHPSNCHRGDCFVMRQLAPAVTNMVYSLPCRPEYPRRMYGSAVERSRYTWRITEANKVQGTERPTQIICRPLVTVG